MCRRSRGSASRRVLRPAVIEPAAFRRLAVPRRGVLARRTSPPLPPVWRWASSPLFSSASSRFDRDAEIVHLAILPGTDRQRAVDLDAVLDRQTVLRDPLSLRPLDVKRPRLTARLVPGSPHLRLDGGVGVPHVAMTLDAYSDALPEPTGRSVEVWAEERSEVASWRAAEGPVLGRAADVEITPLLTIRVDPTDVDYAAAKMLRADRSGVHLRIYADRWVVPPDHIDPWALAPGTTETVASGVLALGHIPLSHKAYARMQPKFDRLAMLGPTELEGYREWQEAQGGYFA